MKKIVFLLALFLLPSLISASVNQLCKNAIESELQKIDNKKIEINFNNLYENNISENSKIKNSSYYYRMYSCNLESLCINLKNYIFGNSSKTTDKINPNNYSTIGCGNFNYKIKLSNFDSCLNNDSFGIIETINYCNKEKELRLKKEMNQSIKEFKNYSLQSRGNLLSAKLLTMNMKMRELSLGMGKLKDLMQKIANKITCQQK